MKSLWQDLRFGARILSKQPGFTLIAIFTLALGIGSNTAIFSVINGVLLKPLPYVEPERLVMLWERNPKTGMEHEFVSPPNLEDWQAQQSVFEHLAYWTPDTELNLVLADGSEKIRASYVSSNLFPALGVPPLEGRGFVPEEDKRGGSRVAVISYDFWQHRFEGAPEVFGKTLTFDTYNRREYTVVGVMPPGFMFPGKTEVWLPVGWNSIGPNRRGVHWLSVLGRLNRGVTLDQAQTEMNAIQGRIETQFPNLNLGSEVAVVPLLEQTVGRKLQTALWVLWGVIAAVLLIACANVANLTLARASARQREIVIRLALGASRWQVVRQLLTESSLLALAGGLLGLLLAVSGIAALKAISAEQVPRLQNVQLDRWALGFTLLASVITSVLCGLAPALQATKQNLIESLKEGSTTSTTGLRRNRLRSGLVVAEVALSLLLLISAGLMLNSFARLVNLNRGFQPDHLLVAKLDFSISGFTTWIQTTTTRPQVTLLSLIQRLQAQPGVQYVGAASSLSRATEPPRQGFVLEYGQPAESPRANFQGVTPDYFRAMGIALLKGREFTEGDTFEAPSVAIINETIAKRYFADENPVGKRLAMEGRTGQPVGPNPAASSPWGEIVGVVADTRKLNLGADTVPEIYVPYWQYPMQTPELVVRTSLPSIGAAAAIRSEISSLNKNLPAPRIQMMDEVLADIVAQPRFHTTLLSLFGVLALVLSAIGIYSVISYSVSQRTHEIGIRMALGAKPTDVLKLVVGRGMWLVLSGIGIGLAASFATTRLMSGLLFEVSATDPLTFAGIPILLAGVALGACLAPASRAARVDPMVALRSE